MPARTQESVCAVQGKLSNWTPGLKGRSPLLSQEFLLQELLHLLFYLPQVAMETPTGRGLLTLIGQCLQLVLILLQHCQGFLLLYGEFLAWREGGTEEKEPNLGSPTWPPSPAFQFQGVMPSSLSLLGETPEISSFFPGGKRPTKISFFTKRQSYSPSRDSGRSPMQLPGKLASIELGPKGTMNFRGLYSSRDE